MSKLLYALGVSVILVFIALGASCLGVYYSTTNVISCGKDGHPPPQEWVYAAGIAYTTFGCVFCLSFVLMIILDNTSYPNPFVAITLATLIIGFSFVISWTIVGAISLWGSGTDCYYILPPIWVVATVTLIISIVKIVVVGILIVPTISSL